MDREDIRGPEELLESYWLYTVELLQVGLRHDVAVDHLHVEALSPLRSLRPYPAEAEEAEGLARDVPAEGEPSGPLTPLLACEAVSLWYPPHEAEDERPRDVGDRGRQDVGCVGDVDLPPRTGLDVYGVVAYAEPRDDLQLRRLRQVGVVHGLHAHHHGGGLSELLCVVALDVGDVGQWPEGLGQVLWEVEFPGADENLRLQPGS